MNLSIMITDVVHLLFSEPRERLSVGVQNKGDVPDENEKCVSSEMSLPDSGPYDYGPLRAFISSTVLSSADKLKLLEGMDRPINFNFPARIEGKQTHQFQASWFSKFEWLTYSRLHNGGYCAYCVLFPPTNTVGTGGNINPGVAVSTPLVKVKKAIELLGMHEKTTYHKTACMKIMDFKDRVSGKSEDITQLIDRSLAAKIEKNRKILKSIISTVELCGRQGIALRGHRDDANALENEHSMRNPGNFQMLLEFRCYAGDRILADHLENCGQNSSYRSKTIQNEVIDVLGDMKRGSILKEVKNAKYFSVLCDEVQDASATGQITFILRYVHKKNGTFVVKESF